MFQYLKNIFHLLHTWKNKYIWAAFLLIISSTVRLLEPKILQIAIDGVLTYFNHNATTAPVVSNDSIAKYLYSFLPPINHKNLNTILLYISIMYIIVAVVRGITNFWSSKISAQATENAIKRIRNLLFERLQYLPMSYYNTANTGELIQRCTGDIETLRKFINQQIIDIVFISTMFIAAFGFMASVHLPYACLALCLSPLLIGMAIFFFKKEAIVWEKHELEQDKLLNLIKENLSGIRVVKAFANENFEIQKFDYQNNEKLKIGLQQAQLHAYYWPLSDFVIHTQTVITILAGAYFALQKQITVGELSSFYFYAGMTMWHFRNLGRIVSEMGMSKVAFERIWQILNTESEIYDGDNSLITKDFKSNIVFKNVYFKYHDTDTEYALENVSFEIKHGQKIGIIGSTGAGKSTIVALLARLYEPSKGEILIDNVPIQQYPKKYLRQKLGIVLQKPFLFSSTLRNNIAYTNLQATDKEVYTAATKAALHQIVPIFENGYQTLIGEKGVTLSGGQQQRTALARTLLQTPALLILDDTTSAVDTETEQYIQNQLNTHFINKTTLIIAHRISTLQFCDTIWVFKKGKLVEQGTHTQLIQNTSGLYKQIYDIQKSVEADF